MNIVPRLKFDDIDGFRRQRNYCDKRAALPDVGAGDDFHGVIVLKRGAYDWLMPEECLPDIRATRVDHLGRVLDPQGLSRVMLAQRENGRFNLFR